jgi:hypothetical protein
MVGGWTRVARIGGSTLTLVQHFDEELKRLVPTR